jgi:hypothetical protein
MKFTLALLAGVFASTITAAPAVSSPNTVPQITFQISNDRTGRQASANTLGDGLARNITDLFRGSAIDESGSIVGTSAQLTRGFTDQTRCFFQNGNTVIKFNGKETFVDLDGQKDIALPVYMNGFNIQCV